MEYQHIVREVCTSIYEVLTFGFVYIIKPPHEIVEQYAHQEPVGSREIFESEESKKNFLERTKQDEIDDINGESDDTSESITAAPQDMRFGNECDEVYDNKLLKDIAAEAEEMVVRIYKYFNNEVLRLLIHDHPFNYVTIHSNIEDMLLSFYYDIARHINIVGYKSVLDHMGDDEYGTGNVFLLLTEKYDYQELAHKYATKMCLLKLIPKIPELLEMCKEALDIVTREMAISRINNTQ